MTVPKLPDMKSLFVALLLALVCATGEASRFDQHADRLASLIDPPSSPCCLAAQS